MKLNIPSKSSGDVAKKLQIVCDKVGMNILKLLCEGNYKYFNELSRELTKQGIASRKTIHARIIRLENAGIVKSRMEPMESSEPDIKRWVRNFYLCDEHNQWVRELVGCRETK